MSDSESTLSLFDSLDTKPSPIVNCPAGTRYVYTWTDDSSYNNNTERKTHKKRCNETGNENKMYNLIVVNRLTIGQ